MPSLKRRSTVIISNSRLENVKWQLKDEKIWLTYGKKELVTI